MTIQKIITGMALLLLFCTANFKAQTVYVTATGKKYHTKNCSTLKEGRRAISLKEAQKEGYGPCLPCKANEIVAVDKKRKTVEAKK